MEWDQKIIVRTDKNGTGLVVKQAAEQSNAVSTRQIN